MTLSGPDTPLTADPVGLPRWPAAEGVHDHLQYHLFFENFFVHVRVFCGTTMENTVVWTSDEAGNIKELVKILKPITQGPEDFCHLSHEEIDISDGPAGGVISCPKVGLEIKFQSQKDFRWLPGGQTSFPVIHRPWLKLQMTYDGKTMEGTGYSKRYWGIYGPHWGYRFIQTSNLPAPYVACWTADATFGLAKYNYFKLLKQDGTVTEAKSEDTYQQDADGYAYIEGQKYHAHVDPVGEWVHDYVSEGLITNSRMQLRYCKFTLTLPTGEKVEGNALNERCFGAIA